ncbi:type III-B CRISPR module RAMP protein Cmr1 [Flectobacillus roseus]|uniref:type III-B CRISPR module RAMP protein Cmr1 n=1 Tax=Flectobacillus roseus TaxID=502259 RepID=UPI0024B68FA6|nr:type III-B CRISPR module RAMP protein Cmr1 [Flectobacillus roseus]MDI9870613.1 type III-B CRISPR module RAMP protein Cmr1 [Flectobacillus roseus]
MQSITFTCEVITPMFLAGADGTTPELRPASIKGALRFWWRAMNGHLVEKDGNLKPLKDREAEIFGGSGEGQGRSRILIRVIPSRVHINKLGRIDSKIKYLVYGADERSFIDVGSTFTIRITVNERNIEKANALLREIKIAFSALVYFGGIGAKSRNGFGSFTSTNILPFDEIKNIIEEITEDYLNIPYTSFNNTCQLYLLSKDNIDSWEGAIEALSDLYKNYGKSAVPKNKRIHIGAPYKNQSPPERHSKLFLMSVFKKSNYLKCVITYLPYNYLNDYTELDKIHIDNARDSWEDATSTFKKAIYEAKKKGNYLTDTLLK